MTIDVIAPERLSPSGQRLPGRAARRLRGAAGPHRLQLLHRARVSPRCRADPLDAGGRGRARPRGPRARARRDRAGDRGSPARARRDRRARRAARARGRGDAGARRRRAACSALSPKRMRELGNALGVRTLAELREAAAAGRLESRARDRPEDGRADPDRARADERAAASAARDAAEPRPGARRRARDGARRGAGRRPAALVRPLERLAVVVPR